MVLFDFHVWFADAFSKRLGSSLSILLNFSMNFRSMKRFNFCMT